MCVCGNSVCVVVTCRLRLCVCVVAACVWMQYMQVEALCVCVVTACVWWLPAG